MTRILTRLLSAPLSRCLAGVTLANCLAGAALAQSTPPGTGAEIGAGATAETFEILDGYDVALDAYMWNHRPVVVFADSPADPRFHEQIAKLMEDVPALLERDVLVFVDTDPARQSPLRTSLRPRGFMMVLIGKDGGVKLRKPLPWSVRELSRTIDKMPIRQREIVEDRAARQQSREDAKEDE